jgi:putative phage-type endonuclease
MTMARITWQEQHDFVYQTLAVPTEADYLRIQNFDQRTPEWKDARKGRLTGSIMGSVVGHNFFCKRDALLTQMLWSTFQGNEATMYGTMKEPIVFDIYEKYLQERHPEEGQVRNVGLCVHRDKPWFAYSPDGVMPTGLLEIKAPFKKKFYGRIPTMYYDQIQYGMWLLGKSHCDFVVYTPLQTSVERFEYNDDYVEEFMIPRAENFYFRKFLPLFLGAARGWVDEGQIVFNRDVEVVPFHPMQTKDFVA